MVIMSKSYSNIDLLIRAEFRRMAWDLGKHLTLFACGAALVGLFFYIFKDFVGEQIASFSPELSKQILKGLSLCGGVFTGLIAASSIVKLETLPRSFLPIMNRAGSSEDALKLQSRSVVAIPIIIACVATALWSTLLKADNLLASEILTVSVALLTRYFQSHKSGATAIEPATTSDKISGQMMIGDWRRHQLLHHAMPGKGLLKLSLCGGALLPLAALAHPHHFLLQTAALCVGITASFGLVYAVAADLPGTWFEKQAGLTHESWTKSWQQIATILTLALLVCGLLAFAAVPAAERMQSLALPIITAFMPWITPALILQIDGRARAANLLVMILIGLFIGTAMIATPWAAIVIPILKSQAAGYQNGRFYRA